MIRSLKMEQNNRNSILVTYGEREAQAWSKVDELVKEKVYPDNKNEIMRRGLHATAQLGEVEEKPLLDLLSTYLSYAIKNEDEYNKQYITIAKSLSLAIFATLIAKRGVLRAETFDVFPITLKLIENFITNKSKLMSESKIDEDEPRRELLNLLTTLETIYLKH